MPGEKDVAAGRSLGLHDVPGGAARGGPAYWLPLKSELLDAGAARVTSGGWRLTSMARRRSGGSAAIRTCWAAM